MTTTNTNTRLFIISVNNCTLYVDEHSVVGGESFSVELDDEDEGSELEIAEDILREEGIAGLVTWRENVR